MNRHAKKPKPLHAEPGQLLKAVQLAKILNCSVGSVYLLARQKKVPTVVIGKLGVRFIAADVIAALTRATPTS